MRRISIKAVACAVGLYVTTSAMAFTPAGGLWGFTNELNGQPGRGFQLTVENDVLLFYYYGYDSDGSGNYMFASGPLVNGSAFTGQLLTCRGGTVMGSTYKAASCSNGPGKVTMAFTSGEKGTITLPGEAPKAINRFNFGYGEGPDTMLGEFMFAYRTSTFSYVDFYNLVTKTGIPSTISGYKGTGMVMNAEFTFACEFFPTVNGFLSIYVCTEDFGNSNDNNYYFRMVGDRGSGTASWRNNTTGVVYPTQILRVATAKGTRTGPYNENHASMLTPRATTGGATRPQGDRSDEANAAESLSNQSLTETDEFERQFATEWAEQARAFLSGMRSAGK